MPQTRTEIRFILNDRPVSLSGFNPDATLLDWLRNDRCLTGSKEGCAEGDCGACTVLVGTAENGVLTYETVNSCIRFLGSLDGTHVATIEHLSRPDGGLSPVQQAMVDCHGSQCGFCTPGIVTSLHALWLSDPEAGDAEIETALQGNLCRCTGYEPIVAAARQAAQTPPDRTNDRLMASGPATGSALEKLDDGADIDIDGPRGKTFVPGSLDSLATLYASHPDATIVAGSTDVGLWVTKKGKDIAPVIHLGRVKALRAIEANDAGLTLGAGVTYSAAEAAIIDRFPQLAPLWNRIGGWQVRNMGTIGGNIANGSPIGDTPPPLIALGAKVTLNHGGTRRTLDLEDFFLDYGKQDRKPGEFVESIFVPYPEPDAHFAVYKISKRRDEDISALLGAFHVNLDGDNRVQDARIAFGGMAGTPKRARTAEAVLIGSPWDFSTVQAAQTALAEDFTPLSDWRASAQYRMLTAQNLFIRFFLETAGQQAQLERHMTNGEA